MSATAIEAEQPSDLVKGDQGDSQWVPKSWFTDPFALLDSLGLGYKASPSGLSYDTLRQIAEHNTIVGSVIQTRIHQVSAFTRLQENKYSVGFRVRHKDRYRRLERGEIRFIRETEDFILNCGYDTNEDRDDLETYIKKVVRDRLQYDQMCTEVVSRYSGKPHSFYAAPAATIRMASPKRRKGSPLTPPELKKEPKYVQVVDGIITNTYTPQDMVFGVANPRTDLRAWGYGYSELEMLIRTVTAHLWAEEWNRKAFSQGSTTKGILNLKGNIPPQQIDAFKRQWMTQISGVSNAWRTPVINSNDDIQWISLQPTNNEMGYQQWLEYLIKVTCAVYLMDPAEINFDMRAGVKNKPMFMTTNESQQKLSQDRGLRPLLRHVQKHVNTVVKRIDPDYLFEYVGIDAKSEEEAIELRLKELNSYKTLNEIRELEQLPPVPHGDIVPNPTYIGYLNQQQLMQQQQAMMGGGAQGDDNGGQNGGVPGMPHQHPEGGGEHPADEGALQSAAKKELGVGDKKRKKQLRYMPDRLRPVPAEDWETTYNAAVGDDDLRKATSVFDDFLIG